MELPSLSNAKKLLIFLLLLLFVIIVFLLQLWLQRSSLSKTDKTVVSKTLPEKSLSRKVATQIDSTIDAKEEKENLEKYLTVSAALLGLNDNLSLYFKDLNKQFEITIDPERSWVPASTIKAFVVLEAFRQRKGGLINFDQRVIIKKGNVVPTEFETYDFPTLNEGTRVTIRELIDSMITQSDNTAYNALLDILDRRNISATLKEKGFIDTVVGEKINLDDDQYQIDLQVPGRQPNKTTVQDFAKLFNLLYEKRIDNADEILAIFKRQKINYMIPALLPENTVIAHKTGEFSPYYHDGGIVYKPSDPFVLAVFTNHDSSTAVSQLAKVAYFKSNAALSRKIRNDSLSRIIGLRWHVVKYLARVDASSVLGTKIKKKFVRLTAADLGITTEDLSIDNENAKDIPSAFITPANILYVFKKLEEKIAVLQARTSNQKLALYLRLAENRISEIKTVLKHNDLRSLSYLLNEFDKDLRTSLTIIQTTDVPKGEVIYVKQLNDLLFATLGENTKYLADEKVSKFIDQIFDFYQSNKKEIVSIVKDAGLENSFEYEPIIGTIKERNGNVLYITVKDGSQKKVNVFSTTQVRAFTSRVTDRVDGLQVGSRIAIVGEYESADEIIPIFILRDLPSEFPQKLEGIITEINLEENKITVQDDSGNYHVAVIDENTILKSRDTEITIYGINVGSQVVMFGDYGRNTSLIKPISITIVVNGSGIDQKSIIKRY